MQWGSLLRTGALLVVGLGMVWLVLNVDLPTVEEVREHVGDLREGLEGLGWLGLLLFVGAYALVAVTPIPVTIMAVTAGILFGTLGGTLLSVVGALLGSLGGYWLARALGRDVTLKLLGSRAETIERQLHDRGFGAVFLLRLMPGMPYWPVNYGSGAFGVKQRDFLVASGIANIPGQVSLVAIGTFVVDPSAINGAVVVAAWIVVIVMTIWAWRSLRGTAGKDLPGTKLWT